MFKNKLWIWLIIIVLVIGVRNLVPMILSIDNTTYKVFIDIDDLKVRNSLSNINKGSHLTLTSYEDGADIIISQHSSKKIDGYVKYDKKIYSPIVVYAYGATSEKSGFTLSAGTYENCASYNFMTLLDAFENEKTYKDLGITYVGDENSKVMFVISSENSMEYEYIKELFYTTLNNGTIASVDDRAKLKQRVDSLLDKCIKVENVTKRMSDDLTENKNNPTNFLYITTETACILNTSLFTTSSSGSQVNYDRFSPVYVTPQIACYFDLYVKEEHNEIAMKRISKAKFISNTGYRIEEDLDSLSTRRHLCRIIKPIN